LHLLTRLTECHCRTADGAAGKARVSSLSGIASDALRGRAGSSPAPGMPKQSGSGFNRGQVLHFVTRSRLPERKT